MSITSTSTSISCTTTSIDVPRASAPRTERRSCIANIRGPRYSNSARRLAQASHPRPPPAPSACMAWPRPSPRLVAGGEAGGLGHHEWLGLLLDREASWRQDKRFAARLRVAKLRPAGARVEDVDYR